MGVKGKLEIEIDIKHSGDVFHELFVSKPHDVSNISPDNIHGCNIQEGEFGQLGSVIQYEYTLGGKKCIAKELIEAIDEEKKIARFKLIEGSDLLNDFKCLTIVLHVITKDDIDAIMWAVEFERAEDIGPYPTGLMDFIIAVTRDIEAHHVEAST